jgi:hypothetical protein
MGIFISSNSSVGIVTRAVGGSESEEDSMSGIGGLSIRGLFTKIWIKLNKSN